MTTTDLKFTPGNKQRGLGWQRALTQPKTSPGPFEAKDFPGSGERVWARDYGMPGPNPLRIWAGKMCSCFARRSLCFPGHQRTNAATECYATAYAAAYANGNILDCCANSCPDSCSDSNSKSNSRGKILTDVICLCFVESSSSTHHDPLYCYRPNKLHSAGTGRQIAGDSSFSGEPRNDRGVIGEASHDFHHCESLWRKRFGPGHIVTCSLQAKSQPWDRCPRPARNHRFRNLKVF